MLVMVVALVMVGLVTCLSLLAGLYYRLLELRNEAGRAHAQLALQSARRGELDRTQGPRTKAFEEEIAAADQQVDAARRLYDNAVRQFNDAIENFPGSLLAGAFGLRPIDPGEPDDAA